MFNGRDRVLALDVGSASLKAVELEAADGRPALRRAAKVDLPPPPDGERDSRPDHRARVLAGLGELLRDMGVKPSKSRRIVSCLPASQVSIKQIRCPALPDAEIRSALVFEARKHLPVEGDVLMDFQVLARRPDDLDVLLVATAKQAVTGHLALLEACGLKGGLIEAPSLALWNAYLELARVPAEEAAVLVNVGASTTSLSFFRKEGLFFTREIPIAGDRFTEDARERHGGDFVAAEKAKVARGLFARDEEQGAGTAGGLRLELEEESRGGNPSLQNLVREILRSVRFYLKESGQGKVGNLVLTGGSAASPGFADYLAKELGMPVETFDPLSRLGEDSGMAPEHRPQFAQAVGMALRGMHEFFPHRLK